MINWEKTFWAWDESTNKLSFIIKSSLHEVFMRHILFKLLELKEFELAHSYEPEDSHRFHHKIVVLKGGHNDLLIKLGEFTMLARILEDEKLLLEHDLVPIRVAQQKMESFFYAGRTKAYDKETSTFDYPTNDWMVDMIFQLMPTKGQTAKAKIRVLEREIQEKEKEIEQIKSRENG